jgi:hypothetical protein
MASEGDNDMFKHNFGDEVTMHQKGPNHGANALASLTLCEQLPLSCDHTCCHVILQGVL